MISWLFLASSLAVVTVPGPDTALVTRLVLRHARRAPALVAAAGMISAGVLHVTLSITGVSLVLRTSDTAFTVVRWCGGALLCAWGVLTLRESFRPVPPPQSGPPVAAGRTYLQGLLCTGSNPKVGLFLLAFLPQFVPAGAAPVPAMTLLAAVHLSIATVWLVVVTELVYQLRQRVFRAAAVRVTQWLTAALFIGLGVRLALGELV